VDEKIYKIIEQWKNESGCNSIIQFNYSYSSYTLTICTRKVGYLIGKGGLLYNKYFDKIKNEIKNLKEVSFVEINNDYII